MITEQKTTQPFSEILDRASAYTPGKRLDTVSIANGDTILAPSALEDIDSVGMRESEDDLRRHLDDVGQGGSLIEQVQTQILKKRLSEIALIRAAHAQVTDEIDHSAEIHELQKLLYDHYSPALFQAALRKKIELLELGPLPKDLEVARAQLLDELDAYANSVDSGGELIELEQPSEETLRAIGDWLKDQFGDIFDEIDAIEGDELDARQLVDVLNLAVMTTPALRDNGWLAKTMRRDKNAVSVFASDRGVVVSEQRRVSKLIAKKLVVHEAFGHALKSGIAETNGDEIGTIGTATYGEFEESFEIALEQCLVGEYDPRRGLDHYITIGLSETVGLSRDKIAQLTNSMRQITLAGDGLTPEKIAKADTLTANQIRRTFAGLTDVDDGIAHRKDIDYLHGLNGAWKLLNAIVEADQVDEGMRWLLSAKFNPYDELDRRLVSQYAQTPSSINQALGL